MRFFLSPLVFALGILCMKYSVYITEQLSGKISLAEKYLGSGIGAGTYTWWKLFGLVLCILAVLWLFNMLPGFPSTPAQTDTTSMLVRSIL